MLAAGQRPVLLSQSPLISGFKAIFRAESSQNRPDLRPTEQFRAAEKKVSICSPCGELHRDRIDVTRNRIILSIRAN